MRYIFMLVLLGCCPKGNLEVGQCLIYENTLNKVLSVGENSYLIEEHNTKITRILQFNRDYEKSDCYDDFIRKAGHE